MGHSMKTENEKGGERRQGVFARRDMDENSTRMNGLDPGQIPVIPLPNPGEGGPVYSGEEDAAQLPALPAPDDAAGGPVYPGVQILPSGPSFARPNAAVRFLNATHGYPPLRVVIGQTRVAALLAAAQVSCPVRVAAGANLLSVVGTDGYIYLQRSLNFRAGGTYIVAIANRNGGLDLTQAPDRCR